MQMCMKYLQTLPMTMIFSSTYRNVNIKNQDMANVTMNIFTWAVDLLLTTWCPSCALNWPRLRTIVWAIEI